MKKLIAILLILAMSLGVCACGSNNQGNVSSNTGNVEDVENSSNVGEADSEVEEPKEPSEDELEVLKTYYQIYCNLNWEGATDTYSVPAEEYEKLVQLDFKVIDKWKNTEYTSSANWEREINWEYKELLDNFTILKDVVINKTTTYFDALTNEEKRENIPHYSITQGEIIPNPSRISEDPSILENSISYYFLDEYEFEFSHNDTGAINQVKVFEEYSDKVLFIITPTYDANGKKISERITGGKYIIKDYDITYTYDSNNRLIQIIFPKIADTNGSNSQYTFDYTYDDHGNVIKKERTYGNTATGSIFKGIEVYQYDEKGYLVTSSYTSQKISDRNNTILESYTDNSTFVIDAQGRIVKKSVVYGDIQYNYSNDKDLHKPKYVSSETVITYGDYYLYTPFATTEE